MVPVGSTVMMTQMVSPKKPVATDHIRHRLSYMPAVSGDLRAGNCFKRDTGSSTKQLSRGKRIFHLIPRDISVCWPGPSAGTDTSDPDTATLDVRSVPERNLRAVSAGQGSGPVLHTDHVLVKSGTRNAGSLVTENLPKQRMCS